MLMAVSAQRGAEGGGGLGGLYPEQGFHMALKPPPPALPAQTFHRTQGGWWLFWGLLSSLQEQKGDTQHRVSTG